MILRRLAEAIRGQNWLTVLIEIAIVVVGIFIGLQVDDWNENRKQKKIEAEALARLHTEAVATVDYFKQHVSYRMKAIMRADKVFQVLFSGKSMESSEDTSDAIASLRFYPTIAPPVTEYADLRSAGVLSKITSRPVRQAISEYHQRLAYIQGQLPGFKADTDQFQLTPEEGEYRVYDPTSAVRSRIVLEIEKAFGNKAYQSDILSEYRNFIRFTQYFLRVLQHAHEMCVALEPFGTEKCPGIDEEWALYRQFNPERTQPAAAPRD